MAQKVEVTFIDDLDGGAADGTVQFGLDGLNYEIDLSDKNAAALRKAFAKYVEHGRKLAGAGRRGARGGKRPGTDRETTNAIREWAKQQGLKVADRGRIPGDIVERYHRETGA